MPNFKKFLNIFKFLYILIFLINFEAGPSRNTKLKIRLYDLSNKSSIYDDYNVWELLDSRLTPTWYDSAKIGIAIPWGPSFGPKPLLKNWDEPTNANFTPDYNELAKEFIPPLYNPEDWSNLIAKSGARYAIFTAKYHDGYCMWPSLLSPTWNSMAIGSRRDLLGEFARSLKHSSDIPFGVYYSLHHWVHESIKYLAKDQSSLAELKSLIIEYKPKLLWVDGAWNSTDNTIEEYMDVEGFLKWLLNESPVKNDVVINDRWYKNSKCEHGDFCTEVQIPKSWRNYKFQTIISLMDGNLTDIGNIIEEIITAVSTGGNVVINIEPSRDGVIAEVDQGVLLKIGFWLGVNGEGIYETKPWLIQKSGAQPYFWYTFRPDLRTVYIFFKWPNATQEIRIENIRNFITTNSTLYLLNKNPVLLKFRLERGSIAVELPPIGKVTSQWWWTLKIVKGSKT